MHTCHAINCNVRTKPEMFMCLKHWSSLKSAQRDIDRLVGELSPDQEQPDG